MKTLLLLILLQVYPVQLPTYLFKSTSAYPVSTLTTANIPSNSSYRPGPKKVSGIDGWYWWLVWGEFNGVPSSATNLQMYDYYDYVQAGGTLSFNDWLTTLAVPVGEPLCLLMICALYILIKSKKLRLTETITESGI